MFTALTGSPIMPGGTPAAKLKVSLNFTLLKTILYGF